MVPSNSTEKSWNEKLEFWHHRFLWEGEQWAFCGASTSSQNKRASLDEEAEKLDSELEESTSLEIDNKKWWRVTQLKKRPLLKREGRETREKEEWVAKEGSLPRRRRKMPGPLDSTKDLSLLQGSHQHFFSFLWLLTNPDFHVTQSSITWFSTFLSQGWSVVTFARWHLLGPYPICSRWDVGIIINIIFVSSSWTWSSTAISEISPSQGQSTVTVTT